MSVNETTKSLAKTEDSAVAIPNEVLGYDGLDQDDFIIPRVRIVQPTSRTGDPGTFFDETRQSSHKELSVVVLSVKKTRVAWNPGEGLTGYYCRSSDSIVPHPTIEHPPCTKCAPCPKARWNGKIKPECTESWNLLCLINGKDPAVINLHGSSIKNTKRFVTNAKLQGKSLFAFTSTIRLEKMVGDNAKKGVYFVIQFSDTKLVSKEDYDGYKVLYLDLSKKVIDVMEEPPDVYAENATTTKEDDEESAL